MANVMQITQDACAHLALPPRRCPDRTGRYLMKDARSTVIYAGRTKSLRKRLRSYFRPSSKPHRKAEMIARIREIDGSVRGCLLGGLTGGLLSAFTESIGYKR